MCGVVGFNWDEKELLHRMMSSINHRGLDQQGNYTDNNISLGNVRLSIIDTSIKGKQPISNEEGNITIVFNGEIYNYIELRAQLEMKGHTFISNTDTEVIVHTYEEYGEECVNYFNGAFAFAIWDYNKKELFMARDRMEIKQLYYYHKNERFIFASKIKANMFIEEDFDRKTFFRNNNYVLFFEGRFCIDEAAVCQRIITGYSKEIFKTYK